MTTRLCPSCRRELQDVGNMLFCEYEGREFFPKTCEICMQYMVLRAPRNAGRRTCLECKGSLAAHAWGLHPHRNGRTCKGFTETLEIDESFEG